MGFQVSDGICLTFYLISIAVAASTLACACVSDVFRTNKASRMFSLLQGILVGTLALGFEIVLAPAYMSAEVSSVFSFIFILAQDVTMGIVTALLPFFLCWLLARPWRRLQKVGAIMLGALYFGLGLVYRLTELSGFMIAQTWLFVGVYLSCLVFLWVSIRRIEDRLTRSMCQGINIVSVCMLPLFAVSYIFDVVGDFSYPAYVLAFSTIMLIYFFKNFHRDKSKAEARQSLTLDNLSKWKITERELGVIKLLTKGLTNKEIAAQLGISVNTVNNHVANIFAKTEVRSRVDLLRLLQSGPWA